MKLVIIWTAVGVLLLLATTAAPAKLVVQVAPPKTTVSKVIVKLDLQNTYNEKIESVRAAIFLMDDQGKVVGQDTRWIIGGTKDKPALAPVGKTTYNFVVSTDKTVTKTKLIVSRIVLENGKLASLKDVQISDPPK